MMEKARTRNWVKLWALLAVPLMLVAGTAWADPDVSLRSFDDWATAVGTGVVHPNPDWDQGMESLYPGQMGYFRVSEIYPMEGFNFPMPEELPGLLMEWGRGLNDPGELIGSWVLDYMVTGDPDLTNYLITIEILPPAGINSVGMGMKDINGLVKYWNWNVGFGPAFPLQPNVQVPITINAMMGGNQANASGFYQDAAFDLTQVVGIIFLEQGNYVNFQNPSPLNHPKPWNYWKKLKVYPNPRKWSQPPFEVGQIGDLPVYWGWDEPSYDPSGISTWRTIRLADDWYCESPQPVTDIHWWGSYTGWLENMPPPAKPVGFMLEIWTDVPAGAGVPYSHPGQLVWHYFVTDPSEIFVGYDKDPRTGAIDSCFYYSVLLPSDKWFFQEPQLNQIYWLSIMPMYQIAEPGPHPWGWKTRPHYFMDFAVKEVPGIDPMWQIIEPEWDLAFELTTYDGTMLKWSQPPVRIGTYNNMPLFNGWDEPAVVVTEELSKQAADDWKCIKPRPVIGIEWWGSYPYWYEPEPPQPPTAFWFGIYTDVPADPTGQGAPYSHPGQLVWQYQTSNFAEVFVGYDTTDRLPPFTFNDSCFHYRVRIPRDKWFWQQPTAANQIYWLSIKAIFPDRPQYEWGWKTRPHFWMDDAVRKAQDPYNTGWEPIYGPDQRSWDLSFVLRSFPRIVIWTYLMDYIGDLNLFPVTVHLRDTLTGTIVRSQTFTLPFNPDELILDDVDPGTYDVMVEVMPHWLRRVAYAVTVVDDDVSLWMSLINGDSDGDNEVTTSDLANVLWAMDSVPGDPNWLAEADLDGDNEVTTSDLATVLMYMDEMGDT